jgi:SAM-dependent methyltransferase
MEENVSLSERFVCDACEDMPVADASLDLILARATIEHLHDVDAFLQLAQRKLRPGGKLIVTFAGKWATFAMLNRLLPEKAKVAVLHTLVPRSKGSLGFPAHYDHSSFREFSSAGRTAGYTEEVGYVSYYGLSYFRFFVPLFLVAYVIDTLRLFLGIRNLSSYNTFVFVRP